MPLVSIIIPNYNHARFLPQRLDSILAQTFQDFELIALDDASSDNSRQVLESYAKKIPMRLVFNEKNSGSPFVQWNRGAAMASGKYLWVAESDDFADARILERLVDILNRNPKVGLAYCQSRQVSPEGQVGGSCEVWNKSLHETRWGRDYQNAGRDEVARFFVIHNIVPNASAALVRRDIFMRAIKGAESRRLSGDWWTWVHMLLESDLAFVAEPLNYYRMHVHSVRETTKLAVACAEEFSIKAHICSQVAVSNALRARSLRESCRKWRTYAKSPGFKWDWKWMAGVRRDAQRIHPLGTVRMLACLFRARAERNVKNILTGAANQA